MIKKIVLGIIVLLVIAFNATVSYIDEHMPERVPSNVYNSCHKVWAARGLYETREEQNSITAMNRAFSRGASGAEVDFHYDVQTNRYIISHDHPKKGSDGKLKYAQKEGGLLTLETFLQEVGVGHYFWLDYKNLDKLSVVQTEIAIKRLLEITDFDNIRERLYIEGSNPLRLPMYTDAGFKTILGIHPPHASNPFASIVANGYKIAYYFKNITALALPRGRKVDEPIYDENLRELYRGIPLFLFHTPDDAPLLDNLMANEDVRVVLVGFELSINRYNINACKEPQ